jgi:hypothetical protein
MSLSIVTSTPKLAPSPPRPELTEAALAALREALRGCAAGQSCELALRGAVQMVCREAHRRGMRVEHLLVTMKTAWQHLPEVRALPLDASRSRLLEHVISMCIEEYYEEGS